MATHDISRRSFLAGVGSLVVAGALLPMTAQASTRTIKAKRKKSVVICFSCTGTTLGFARRIKKATGATLLRVKARKPYTAADRDWNDDSSRVSRENETAPTPAQSKVRPEIANLGAIKKAVKAADIVYIGYPIWFGEAPHIMYTLVEAVSLKGKTVVPFCTSAASGLGSSAKHLRANARTSKKTIWKKGKNYYDIPSQKKVTAWLTKSKLV